jgi:hypothetical protein
MRTHQNENNILLNFPRSLSILLETTKTDNNALDIAIYNLKFTKTYGQLYYEIKCKISMGFHYVKTT